jgi:iron transport multicopper oxidase
MKFLLLILFPVLSTSLITSLTFDKIWMDTKTTQYSVRYFYTMNYSTPAPLILVQKNTNLIINVTNLLEDDVSVHLHGQTFQNNNQMDGVMMVTQCPIKYQTNFIINMIVEDHPGTFWYHDHSHNDQLRYTGLYGPLIVYDFDNPNYAKVDGDFVIMLHDIWSHPVQPVFPQYSSLITNSISSNTINPDLTSINTLSTISVNPGGIYRFRIVGVQEAIDHNIAFDSSYVTMTIEAIDGMPLSSPKTIKSFFLSIGQTVDLILTFSPDTPSNSIIPLYAKIYKWYNCVQPTYQIQCVRNYPAPKQYPYKKEKLVLFQVSNTIVKSIYNFPALRQTNINLSWDRYKIYNFDGSYKFGTQKFFHPQYTPLIASNLTLFELSSGFIFDKQNMNERVLRIFINNGYTPHPIHAHGQYMQVFCSGNLPFDISLIDSNCISANNLILRHTIFLDSYSWTAAIFEATNEGLWMMHCHRDQHSSRGMATILQYGLTNNLGSKYGLNCSAVSTGYINKINMYPIFLLFCLIKLLP